jgi:hypothetical protein
MVARDGQSARPGRELAGQWSRSVAAAAPGWPALEVRPERAQSPAVAPMTREKPGKGGGRRRLARVSSRGRRGAVGPRQPPPRRRPEHEDRDKTGMPGTGHRARCRTPRAAARRTRRPDEDRLSPTAPRRAAPTARTPGTSPSHPPAPVTTSTAFFGFSLVIGAKAGDCARSGRTSRAGHPGQSP